MGVRFMPLSRGCTGGQSNFEGVLNFVFRGNPTATAVTTPAHLDWKRHALIVPLEASVMTQFYGLLFSPRC